MFLQLIFSDHLGMKHEVTPPTKSNKRTKRSSKSPIYFNVEDSPRIILAWGWDDSTKTDLYSPPRTSHPTVRKNTSQNPATKALPIPFTSQSLISTIQGFSHRLSDQSLSHVRNARLSEALTEERKDECTFHILHVSTYFHRFELLCAGATGATRLSDSALASFRLCQRTGA